MATIAQYALSPIAAQYALSPIASSVHCHRSSLSPIVSHAWIYRNPIPEKASQGLTADLSADPLSYCRLILRCVIVLQACPTQIRRALAYAETSAQSRPRSMA